MEIPFRGWLQDHRLLALKLLIVSILLISAAGIALLMPRFPQSLRLLILGLPLFPIMGVLLLLYPPLGMIGLILAGLLVRFGIQPGSTAEIGLATLAIPLLICFWLLNMILQQKRLWLLSSRPILPLIVFACVGLLSFLIGQFPWFKYANGAPLTSQLAGLAIFLFSAAAFLLAAHQIPNERWLQYLTWLFLSISAIYVSGLLIPTWGRMIFSILPKGSAGSMFWVWLGALGFAQALLNRRLRIIWRLLLLLLVFGAFFTHFHGKQSWVSGWLPMLVGIGVIVLIGLQRVFKRRFIPLLILGCILAVPLILWQANSILERDQYSVITRLEAWWIMGEIIKVNPILGLGPANYRFYTPLFPIMGYAVQFNSHNNYVDIVAQTGILGLVIFLWFVVELFVLSWRLYKSIPVGFSQAYTAAVIGGLAGTLVAGTLGDWIIPFVYNVGLLGFRASVIAWIFLGGLLVVEKNYPKN